MGNYYSYAIKGSKCLYNKVFAIDIQMICRLIKNKNPRRMRKSSKQLKTLLLTSREGIFPFYHLIRDGQSGLEHTYMIVAREYIAPVFRRETFKDLWAEYHITAFPHAARIRLYDT